MTHWITLLTVVIVSSCFGGEPYPNRDLRTINPTTRVEIPEKYQGGKHWKVRHCHHLEGEHDG